jgi:hypothetical protein
LYCNGEKEKQYNDEKTNNAMVKETNSSQNVMTMAHALIIGLIGKQAKLNYLIFYQGIKTL